MTTMAKICVATAGVLVSSSSLSALDDAHWQKAQDAMERGLAHLRQVQRADGSWSPQPGPAITAMVLSVMLDRPNISTSDETAQKALAFILSKRRDDGGIHDGFLQNYNTAICLSTLARVHDQEGITEAIREGQNFLRELQWYSQPDPKGIKVDPSHPFFGGAGYGKHGRPDLSNTQTMLEGLYHSGLSCDDPAFRRALVFITRCQGTELNDMFADKILQDGGFIYATSIDRNQIGIPQSMANADTSDEVAEGRSDRRLRSYGSMTYAGFKSYVYAALRRDDPRVIDAYNWIRRNYTVEHNPGMPEKRKFEGYYYYLMTMSRALHAWGATNIETAEGVEHDWANDIIDQLVDLQRDDGSWVNQNSRWMEKDPNLVTANALIALTHALK